MQPGKEKALFVAKKIMASLVFNMAKLEGNPYTFPEVQTLLEGVTVGGHKVSDQEQVLHIADGWKRLIKKVETDKFRLDAETAIELNAIVAKDEALSVGGFRDGNVGIQGTDYRPPTADRLDEAFVKMVGEAKEADLPGSAYRLFLESSANQYFWDGNKRTGQLMMNGHLMSNGYLPVSIPAKSQLEYNQLMVDFYDTGKMAPMEDFLSQSTPWPTSENEQEHLLVP
ncbi:MAG: Fic family protein [Chromatiales bacterium]|nr:Fic family protein [Gammaproteobacteria bacterium]